ncbi:MAG TPA: hypothetical protein VF836_03480 [Gemmatimonadaceae bacterium]
MIRRILRLLCLSLGLLATSGRILQAQRTLSGALGSKIRVQPQGDTEGRVGRLTGVAPDTVRLRPCESCSVDSYFLPSLSAVQVSVGRKRHGSTIAKGAFFGAVIGLASGMFYGWQKTRGCKPGDDMCGLEYLAVPFLGAGGLAIGAAVGGSIQYDDWRPALIR